MNKIKYLLLFSVLLMTSVLTLAQGKNPRVLILDTLDKTGVSYMGEKVRDVESYITVELRRKLHEKRICTIVTDNQKLTDVAVAQSTTGEYDLSTAVELGRKLGAEVIIMPSLVYSNIQLAKSGGGADVRLEDGTVSGGILIDKKHVNITVNIEAYDIATGELLGTASALKEKSVSAIGGNLDYSGTGVSYLYTPIDTTVRDIVTAITTDAINSFAQQVSGEIKVQAKLYSKSKLVNGGQIVIEMGAKHGITDRSVGRLNYKDKLGFLFEFADISVVQVQEDITLLEISNIEKISEKSPTMFAVIQLENSWKRY